MPATKTPAPPLAGTTLAERERITGAFIALVTQVPDEPDGDVADLLGPILAAKSWEELNTVSTLPSSKTLVGRELRLERVTKKVSDKQSITGYYLFCRGYDMATGEELRWTAGGGQAVAVMSQLHCLGELPAKIRYDAVDVGEGNTAVNCRVLDVFHD